METARFDQLTRTISVVLTRRALAAVLSLGAFALPGRTDAKKKQRRRRKKVKRNTFGCVDVGKFCKNAGQCCSGICTGKKDKKKCRDHDTGGCTGEQDVCAGVLVPCVTTAGENGACVRTTGKAGYCEISGGCSPCTRDTDCQATCGPLAACIVCELECGPNGTACVGPSETSCTLPE